MPNGGNPNFKLSEQDAWFAPLSEVICDVARRHNLLLEKYYHESPTWSLRFNHPRGGQASVSVLNGGSSSVAKLESVWHLDDYDQFTRFLHWRRARDVSKDAETVRRELEIEFAAILAVPLGQWNQLAKGYERVWGQFTKSAFQAMTPKLPDPLP